MSERFHLPDATAAHPAEPLGATPAAALEPLLRGLNPEQRAAVTLPAQSALILAGAGSGKTRVLTTRIAWLLSSGQASASEVLAVTFTNKAAREMQTRLAALLPLQLRGMWIGTFHGLCNRLLRAHCQLAALPPTFQILDTQDQLSAIKRLHKQLGLDEERHKPKDLQWFIAGCKEDGLRAHQVPVRDDEQRQRAEFYRLYDEQCQREGVLDFGELMLRCYELLRDQQPLRQHYQRRFRHILVDEFQDTNKLQYAWLKLLAGTTDGGRFQSAGNAVLAVGDDDQSIYAFRGARVGNMADFLREFGVAQPLKLEQNYRSQAHILHAANALIAHNRSRLGKQLRTAQGAGELVRVYAAASDYAEAHWVVDEVRQLCASDGLARQQIAVLYRSNAQSRVLEGAFFNAGVPYRVYGGLRFFERAEVKHALAYLRLLDNPNDDTSFLRVVNFPARGIGSRSIEQLQAAAAASGGSLHSAVSRLSGKAGASLGAFLALLDVLREQSLGLSLSQIVEQVLQHSGLLAHYRAERDGADRVENLEELVNAAQAFVQQEGFGRTAPALPAQAAPTVPATAAGRSALPLPLLKRGAASDDAADSDETLSPLQAFLSHAALEAGDNQAQNGQDAVQLMTVHAAKGLEFEAVFITGLEEGLFPHEQSAAQGEALEEERRLMYVAITRARQRLYLSHAQTRLLHGQTRFLPCSRFVDELPPECLQWLTPRPGGAWSGSATGGANWAAGAALQPAWGRSGLGASAAQQAVAAGGTAGFGPGSANAGASASAAAPGTIRVGMAVFHPKFGQGQVLALEGRGDDARVQVSFTRHGHKWLLLALAKLAPL